MLGHCCIKNLLSVLWPLQPAKRWTIPQPGVSLHLMTSALGTWRMLTTEIGRKISMTGTKGRAGPGSIVEDLFCAWMSYLQWSTKKWAKIQIFFLWCKALLKLFSRLFKVVLLSSPSKLKKITWYIVVLCCKWSTVVFDIWVMVGQCLTIFSSCWFFGSRPLPWPSLRAGMRTPKPRLLVACFGVFHIPTWNVF